MPTKMDERAVKTAKAPAKGTVSIWDSEVKGFGLRIFAPTRRHPEGARSFFLNYRALGVERRLTIGEYPTWSALAARNEARDLRKRIDRGEDPALEKREARKAPTVADLAERYRAEHLPRKAPSSQKADWQMIEREILPVLGERKVADVHHGDMVALHGEITTSCQPGSSKSRPLGCEQNVRSLAQADGRRKQALERRGAGQPVPGRRAQPGGRAGTVLLVGRTRRFDRRARGA